MISLFRMVATTVCVLSLNAAQAHHSYAQFDRTKDFSITGSITHIDWANPHVIVMVKTHDSELYTIEWQSMNLLIKSGLNKDSLRIGDNVTLVGARNRDPKLSVVTLIKEINVPARNWRWEKPPSPIVKTSSATNTDAVNTVEKIVVKSEATAN